MTTASASDATLPRLLAEAAAAYPDRVALRFEGRSTTYADLGLASRRFARGLVAAGVVKGARVALLMANRPEWIVAAFGVWMAGGVLVPVSTFAAAPERDYILRHSDASVLLLQRRLLRFDFVEEMETRHPALAERTPGRARVVTLPCLRRIVCLGAVGAGRGAIEPWSALETNAADVSDELLDALATEVTPADDAVIVYTSGTTAEPKAVLHAHRAPVLQARHFAEYMRLRADDRLWTTQPFFWVAGIAVSLGATLVAGATLVLEEVFDPAAALARIDSERVTVIRAWRHQEQAMADHPDASRRDLSSVRKLNFASPLSPLVGLTADAWGTQGGYGLTETFTVVSDLPADAPSALRDATAGKPLEGVALRIVDPDTGELMPTGAEGEIVVRARTLMRGYYKTPPERFLDDAGFFRTGDSGFLDPDGYLHWTGRLSTLIKTGGANVSPAEVEAAASGYPGIRTAIALGVPHLTLGEEVALCVVPSDDRAPIDEQDLQRFLRERLAAYKVPKRLLVLSADEVPRTGTAKVRLGALRELLLGRSAGLLGRGEDGPGT